MTVFFRNQRMTWVFLALVSASVWSVELLAACRGRDITKVALAAPKAFSKGKLYGHQLFTEHTNVNGIKGFLSCSITTYAILREAGCPALSSKAKRKVGKKKVSMSPYRTNDLYTHLERIGWKRKPRSKIFPGCVVAWNGKQKGKLPPIAEKRYSSYKVKYRHIGVVVGPNESVNTRYSFPLSYKPKLDNGLVKGKYQAPFFICPPRK